MTQQTFAVPASPAQRFILLQLSHADGQRLKGQRGRVFRRFMRAFALDRLRDVMAANEDKPVKIDPAIYRATQPALFEVTMETVEYALELAEVDHAPQAEMELGPLFDILDDIKAGRVGGEAGAPALEGEVVPPFDPERDDWTPKGSPPDPVEAAAEKIAAHLRAAGEARAADLVERGTWDAPDGGGSRAGAEA